jgi:hypothetical protein
MSEAVVQACCPLFVLHAREPQNIISLDPDQGPPAIYWVHDPVERSITYVLAFQRDDGVVNCGFRCGGHEHDVEFVRVFYNSKMEMTKAYFSAHSSDQGTWVTYDPPRQLRIMAYVSLGTHAIYPQPGTVARIFCFGNDVSTSTGETLNTDKLRPMPTGALQGPRWDSFQQWSYTTEALKGAPKDGALVFRLFYPLTRRR